MVQFRQLLGERVGHPGRIEQHVQRERLPESVDVEFQYER
ncbi:hypothetical protein M271_34290 [Streptomyces rapamycinicus NRRL 5491]|nr:hypothetical protein M271_34290 [Streptomyces rapamycinicus NRRL 5491]